jgi:SOR/SNZ family
VPLVVWQVLTPADDAHHINKHNFKVPFVCGCRDLGEALRRIAEGAAMIRTKGEWLHVLTPPVRLSRFGCLRAQLTDMKVSARKGKAKGEQCRLGSVP